MSFRISTSYALSCLVQIVLGSGYLSLEFMNYQLSSLASLKTRWNFARIDSGSCIEAQQLDCCLWLVMGTFLYVSTALGRTFTQQQIKRLIKSHFLANFFLI